FPTTASAAASIPSSIARTRSAVGGTIGRPSVHWRASKAAWTASSVSSSSTTSAASGTRLTGAGGSAAQAGGELGDGGRRLRGDALGRLTAERMRNHEQGQALHPEGVSLVMGQGLEGAGGDDRGGRARPLQRNGVVETPRRAGASVG